MTPSLLCIMMTSEGTILQPLVTVTYSTTLTERQETPEIIKKIKSEKTVRFSRVKKPKKDNVKFGAEVNFLENNSSLNKSLKIS